MTDPRHETGRIAVVGPCASGKSTVVKALRMHGYDAHAVSQEHSSVQDLWDRQNPDILIALKADLESVRIRRNNPKWRSEVWNVQQDRLAHAYEHADLVEDTTNRNVNDVVRDVLRYMTDRGIQSADEE